MADPETDDDALSWAGDEQEIARPTRPEAAVAPSRVTGAPTLVALGILGGIALLEALGWMRSVLSATLEATLEPGSGALATVAFAVNLLGRVAAVAAPVLWFVLAAWRIRTPSRRFAWLALGAVLLLPWPALMGLL
ncbi:hypothetical protein [Amnibacterium sp.]|uniref:hypothetical protein n=1 Tax=Amnibacterium sp. TaxID=1872496 RepID=UPI00260DE23A|nr:hypothetical protein [Amnibacterium sp.]MCU1473068.1 hypothetical protein [Amnibacterium sp.]